MIKPSRNFIGFTLQYPVEDLSTPEAGYMLENYKITKGGDGLGTFYLYSKEKKSYEWQDCDNYKDIQEFEKPIPIVWIAKLDGCLVSCLGASFTRVPEDKKHPRFAGYYSYDKSIPDQFLQDGLTLKIYGEWIGIDADHSRTVFENKCVPMVDIEKIEVIK